MMKLRDLFEYVESRNKFVKFMDKNCWEKEIVKIDDYAFRDDDFISVKELVKTINENFYANIDENIELLNDDGYIQMTFEQSIPDYKDGKFEYKKEHYTLNIYLYQKQVWEV